MANAPSEPITKHVRLCVGCAQHDDHPRHVIAMAGGQVANWHMDCHVLATDCEVCAAQLAACDTSTASDGVIGDELQTRLIALRDTKED
jgi:hypothetical protein